MGIENYNIECRKIVMRYSKDWEASIRYSIKANDIEVTEIFNYQLKLMIWRLTHGGE
jgi:hypothetical protein